MSQVEDTPTKPQHIQITAAEVQSQVENKCEQCESGGRWSRLRRRQVAPVTYDLSVMVYTLYILCSSHLQTEEMHFTCTHFAEWEAFTKEVAEKSAGLLCVKFEYSPVDGAIGTKLRAH